MSLYTSYGSFLEEKGIRASSQRILMLEYLEEAHNHPTADKIYIDLSQRLPSISKATVYNNLKLFLTKGIIKEINIDNIEVHYEISNEEHAHFVCKECGEIEDLEISDVNVDLSKIPDYEVHSQDIFLKGICKECLKNKQN